MFKNPYTTEQLDFVDKVAESLNSYFGKVFTSKSEAIRQLYSKPLSDDLIKYLKQSPVNFLNHLLIEGKLNGINFTLEYLRDNNFGLHVNFSVGDNHFTNNRYVNTYLEDELIYVIEEITNKVKL